MCCVHEYGQLAILGRGGGQAYGGQQDTCVRVSVVDLGGGGSKTMWMVEQEAGSGVCVFMNTASWPSLGAGQDRGRLAARSGSD